MWEAENRWVEVDGSTRPTAFVAGTAEGVELDVHVIEVDAGVVVPLCDVPWPFDALNGVHATALHPRLESYGALRPPTHLMARAAGSAGLSQLGWWGAVVIGFYNTRH